MDFCSPFFLFLFLPIVLAGYWTVGLSCRNFFLLFVSLFFYAWGDSHHFLVLLLTLATNYGFSILIDRCQHRKTRLLSLAATIATNLVILGAFKYLNFFAENLNPILLYLHLDAIKIQPLQFPLGLSFLAFQAIAYAIDIYRQEYSPQRNFIKFSLFMALFPKISAGPIIRYPEVEQTLSSPLVTLDSGAYGAKRFIFGMGKKLIIADTLAKTADQIFAIPSADMTAGLAWLGIICYTLQLYFDFSGYTDMAIGLGRMFGFTFRENFDYPYIAKSVTEFWRRWHMSLSTWFRDYLFTPLSYALMTPKIRKKIAEGKYKTNYRGLFSVFVVFTLCGLWHGPSWNFILWGMLHGIILAFENWKFLKVLKKTWAPLTHTYLLFFVMISWVFFRSPTLSAAMNFLKSMAGFGSGKGTIYHSALFVNVELLAVLTIAILAAMPTAAWVRAYWGKLTILPASLGNSSRSGTGYALEAVFAAVILAVSLVFMAGSTYKPFIYLQF